MVAEVAEGGAVAALAALGVAAEEEALAASVVAEVLEVAVGGRAGDDEPGIEKRNRRDHASVKKDWE